MTDRRAAALAEDENARKLAQTEFHRPLVIEAGAGTGKTALLVARVVAWCVGPGWEQHSEDRDRGAVAREVVEGVVAITFTEAAAAEMAERVARSFSNLAAGEIPVGVTRKLLEVNDEELAARAAELADEVHRLRAQTIHSWCHHLLRAFPLEAGVHPAFEIDADGACVEEAVTEAVAETLRELPASPDRADWEFLAAAGVMPVDIADAVQRLVSAGASTAVLLEDPCAPDAMEEVLGKLRDALDGMHEAGVDALAAAGSKTGRIGTALVGLRRELSQASSEDPSFAAEALNRLEDEVRSRLRDWSKGTLTKTERGLAASETALSEAASELLPLIDGLRNFAPVELGAARRVLAELIRVVTRRLDRTGVVTYDDLLRRTADLLESSDGVRREVRAGIHQLLVDEFQDTDDTQCRMIRSLALIGDEFGPGLFIVGDPKQSIYGWRRADLAAYDRFKGEVQAAGGLVCQLVQNFRSTQVILDEVARMVEPVMVRRIGIQPEFQHLEATGERRNAPGFDIAQWAPVEHWVTRPADPADGGLTASAKVAEAIALEAEAVATDIRRLLDGNHAGPGDIAVLVRSTPSLEPLLDRLREADVPFEVAREREYYRQREVVETAALVRHVIEPADQLALLTVLRSDVVGVPDAALAPLWDAGLPGIMARIHGWDSPMASDLESCIERAAEAIPDGLPGLDELPNWSVTLRTAARTVGHLRQTIREQPPHIFVERLRTLWLNEATASARFLGRFRRSRLERFYGELETSLAAADGSLTPVARMLRRAVEEGREPQVPTDPDVAADAVHVMTIHGAKGLDFEHVYLCQIQKGDPKGPGGSTVELRSGGRGLEYRLFGWPTPGFGAAEQRRVERDRAERARLLYVATTRAKNRLVISGRWKSDGELIPAREAGSFEDLLAHRVPCNELDERARAGEARWTEADRPVQWVLPALESWSAQTSGRQFSGPKTRDPGPAARDAALLADLRVEAERRARLPISVAASSLHGSWDGSAGARDEPVGEAAAAVGTAVHRLLEIVDLRGDLPAQVAARRAEVLDWAAAGAAGAADVARQRATELLGRLIEGRALLSLEALADAVVARELPLLVAAGEDDPAVSAILGVADLVYRRDTRLVVADYKTDALSDDDEITARAEFYRPQLELYARALRDALELDDLPAMELWFLWPDRIKVLE